MPRLVLGPMLRFVDAASATIWVQTDVACEVEVLGARAPTWCVDGLHFALVCPTGLEPGGEHPYEVRLDGVVAWPAPDSPWPPSVIRPPAPGAPTRIAFGSCRITRPHEPPHVLRSREHPDGHGVDALRAFALRAAREGGARLPDMVLMLGDQIYADEPSPALRETLARRPRTADAPEGELADFCEYALAYAEAWDEDALRWLMSTVPCAMVFDDHEIHAEWRISAGWMAEMTAKPWFDRHICAGLKAYWVFQHLGNLSPAELDASELYARVREAPDAGELLGDVMDDAGRQHGHSRWSWARDIGGARLVVIDSRAGRDVTPGAREMVPDREWEWIRDQASAPARHLLLASSVPFLLAPGLHHTEAWDEALTDGAWGRAMAWVGERLRRVAVMDHWASFGRSHRRVVGLLADAAHGRLGEAPSSVVMLSGDVHHCYVAEVGFPAGSGATAAVWQVVCSAFRKELAPHERVVIGFGHSRLAARLAQALARAAGVPDPRIGWRIVDRPAYANQISTLTLDGERAEVAIEAVVDGSWQDPRLETVIERRLASGGGP
ncbi:alkaline phosphatase family protein [Baekduia soli]|uniref:Alkaline phosphatase family protein n=1 Tax=Baekduia soli TaxID=496014 RepID=A0A5B8U4G9_9ACTN|nr:alkaline phosphatase D family protein [Baekduia soli]QEC47953.1 alkaline phosphatase family protein [Baekduia soli]